MSASTLTTTSTDTAGGADSLVFASVTSASVYGAAGNDTLSINDTHDSVYADLGTGGSLFTGAGNITASTLIGGASADTFNFAAGVSNTSIIGGDGADSVALAASFNLSSTITAGAGADTLVFSSGVSTSSILGGAGTDTFTLSGAFIDSTIVGGAGADSIRYWRTRRFSPSISAELVHL